MKHIPLFLVVTLATSAAWGAPGWPEAPHAPQSLNDAHRAFLDGKYADMFTSLVRTLEQHPRDKEVTDNALALLDKAYEVNKGSVPSDVTLPPDILKMRVDLVRRQRPDAVEYQLRIAGALARHGAIRQLQLTRHADRTVLDREAGVGTWEEEVAGDGTNGFELTSPCEPHPAAEGLYALRIVLDDGRTITGHVILAGLVASEAPVSVSPARGEKVGNGPVMLRWNDFHSPEHRPFEHRGLWMAIFRAEAPTYDWEYVWSNWVDSPVLTSFSVDKMENGAPLNLKDGRHIFVLNYSEARQQGPISMRRVSVKTTPFYVGSGWAP